MTGRSCAEPKTTLAGWPGLDGNMWREHTPSAIHRGAERSEWPVWRPSRDLAEEEAEAEEEDGGGDDGFGGEAWQPAVEMAGEPNGGEGTQEESGDDT
jgi:hypothetical protein